MSPQRLLKKSWWNSHSTQVLGAYVVAAVTLLLLLGVYSQGQTTQSAVDQIQKERAARTAAFCGYAHQQQVDKRRDAIKGFRQLPLYARFFNDPNGDLAEVARKNLIEDLGGKYGNHRLPAYCPQHNWPEKLPKDLSG
jgi:hypothetical protein